MVKNPNWQEVDQLAIYKRGRGVELLATKKLQLLLGVRAGLELGASGLQVRRPNPLDHTASIFIFIINTSYTVYFTLLIESNQTLPTTLVCLV